MLEKIRRHLGVFYVDDYPCFCTEIKRNDKLEFHYEATDKKVYIHTGDDCFGSLKMNELEQRFILAILSSNKNLLEGRWVASEEQMQKDQKYRVSVWIKESEVKEEPQKARV